MSTAGSSVDEVQSEHSLHGSKRFCTLPIGFWPWSRTFSIERIFSRNAQQTAHRNHDPDVQEGKNHNANDGLDAMPDRCAHSIQSPNQPRSNPRNPAQQSEKIPERDANRTRWPTSSKCDPIQNSQPSAKAGRVPAPIFRSLAQFWNHGGSRRSTR